MIIKTKIVFKDEKSEKENELLGKEVYPSETTEYFEFDMENVDGIMPDKNPKRSIIFLCGADLLIETPFEEIREKWAKCKVRPPDRPKQKPW